MKTKEINKKKIQSILKRIGEKCPFEKINNKGSVSYYMKNAPKELRELKKMGVNYGYFETNRFINALLAGIPEAIESIKD
jgi:hypothetical protein